MIWSLAIYHRYTRVYNTLHRYTEYQTQVINYYDGVNKLSINLITLKLSSRFLGRNNYHEISTINSMYKHILLIFNSLEYIDVEMKIFHIFTAYLFNCLVSANALPITEKV